MKGLPCPTNTSSNKTIFKIQEKDTSVPFAVPVEGSSKTSENAIAINSVEHEKQMPCFPGTDLKLKDDSRKIGLKEEELPPKRYKNLPPRPQNTPPYKPIFKIVEPDKIQGKENTIPLDSLSKTTKDTIDINSSENNKQIPGLSSNDLKSWETTKVIDVLNSMLIKKGKKIEFINPELEIKITKDLTFKDLLEMEKSPNSKQIVSKTAKVLQNDIYEEEKEKMKKRMNDQLKGTKLQMDNILSYLTGDEKVLQNFSYLEKSRIVTLSNEILEFKKKNQNTFRPGASIILDFFEKDLESFCEFIQMKELFTFCQKESLGIYDLNGIYKVVCDNEFPSLKNCQRVFE